jgi:hypothetical protein
MKLFNNLGASRGFSKQGFLTVRHFTRSAGRLREDTMTKQEMVYMKFEAFEEQLAHCYFLLHERFIANPPLAAFWEDTALAELQHQSLLRYCRDRRLMSDVVIDAATVQHVEQLLDTVKGIISDPEVSVGEAFYASLLMESSELDEVYEKLTCRLAKDHRLLFDAIRRSLRSHHENFADAAQKFLDQPGMAEAFRNLSLKLR